MKAFYLALPLVLLLPAIAGAQSLGNYPGSSSDSTNGSTSTDSSGGSAPTSSYDLGYTTGYNEGTTAGYTTGYNEGTVAGDAIGFNRGFAEGIAQCLANPASCGINLATLMSSLDFVNDFGETEPNDHLVGADQISVERNYWGQSYGAANEDWFYTITELPNQNLIINFSVPESSDGIFDLAGWSVSVRDFMGNSVAEFDTAVTAPIMDPAGTMTYRATLGFAGTYYIVVKASDPSKIYSSYRLSIVQQDTDQDSPNYIVGFYDTETESNDLPSLADPLASSVTMYGLVNLRFNNIVPDPEDETLEMWGQGEPDWFVYQASGNEIISLSFCARESCGAGDWHVEVFDEAMARRIERIEGLKPIDYTDKDSYEEYNESLQNIKPLLSFNTDNTNAAGEAFRFGLSGPGRYFMSVSHKRLFSAPCSLYQYQLNPGESDPEYGDICSCDSRQAEDPSKTGNACYLPVDPEKEGVPDEDFLLKIAADCIPGIDTGCEYIENNPPGCWGPDNNEDADGEAADGEAADGEAADGEDEECKTYQTLARCVCSVYGSVVEIPENDYSSPYNFTWQATKLPPNTLDSEAYEDFEERPSPY